MFTSTDQSSTRSSPSVNFSLTIGVIIVISVVLLGFFGPLLAPRDPLQENFVVFIDDINFIKPPFAAFLVRGFPLGSDEFGRDILSRILWGIKPTLILIVVVAALRLLFGCAIGILAGWHQKKKNFWDTLIQGSGVLPVIFISLCVIAATGQKLGMWAFIIGLLLTGWGDVARIVSNQTRIVKSQLFIEAAQALGSSGAQILGLHIIPQIIPTLWMMFTFEASQALLITAELGVLGYFLNAIWIPVGDWVGLRTSGMPELGQMLGDIQKQPWGALSAGFIVFITILGFNLLGEGIRRNSSIGFQRSRNSRLVNQVHDWIEDNLLSRSFSIKNNFPVYLMIVFLVGLILGGGIYLEQSQAQDTLSKIPPLPGGNLWAGGKRDSQGTYWAPYVFPSTPREEWRLDLSSAISGSPVVNNNGIIFVATMDSRLHAVSPAGKELWSVALPNTPTGSVALTSSGKIVVIDLLGGATLVNSNQKVVEVVKGISARTPGISDPIAGSDNSIYYATTTHIFCIDSTDQLKWKIPLPTYSITSPALRLTSDNKFLLFDDFIINTETGSVIKTATPEPLDRYVIGANGNLYRFTQTFMSEVDLTQFTVESGQVKWDARGLGTGFRLPSDSGVTPDNKIWLLYASPYDYIKFIWLDKNGITLNIIDYPYRGVSTSLIAIDRNNATIICGTPSNPPGLIPVSECRIHPINSANLTWKIEIPGGMPTGGALVENRLYIGSAMGTLFSFTNIR